MIFYCTPFFPMFPFDLPESIRNPKLFLFSRVRPIVVFMKSFSGTTQLLRKLDLIHLFRMQPFSNPWKHRKTIRFSGVFRGIERVPLGTNGLLFWSQVDWGQKRFESARNSHLVREKCYYHTETSWLICKVNQLTGFYM